MRAFQSGATLAQSWRKVIKLEDIRKHSRRIIQTKKQHETCACYQFRWSRTAGKRQDRRSRESRTGKGLDSPLTLGAIFNKGELVTSSNIVLSQQRWYPKNTTTDRSTEATVESLERERQHENNQPHVYTNDSDSETDYQIDPTTTKKRT